MRITLSARSKVLQLFGESSCFRVQTSGDSIAGVHVELLPNSELREHDFKFCDAPLIVADMASTTYLANRTLDFDFDTNEFVIITR